MQHRVYTTNALGDIGLRSPCEIRLEVTRGLVCAPQTRPKERVILRADHLSGEVEETPLTLRSVDGPIRYE